MHYAVIRRDNQEHLISADAAKKEFDSRPAIGIWTCPRCMREVDPAAFESINQKPHFRHKRNDDLAKLCEDYMGGAIDESDNYNRQIIQLILRRSKNNTQRFNVEIGLRHLGEKLLAQCSEKDFVIIEGRKYRLQDFADPTFRVKVETLRFDLHESVEIIAAPSLKKVIGDVEDSRFGMIFSADFGELGGRRLRIGEPVITNHDYYLVVPQENTNSVTRCFGSASRIGEAKGEENFVVLKFNIDRKSRDKKIAEPMLERMGFYLADYDDMSDLLWPPALVSERIVTPLFRDSPLIYASRYMVDEQDKADQVVFSSLRGRTNDSRAYGVLGSKYARSIDYQDTFGYAFIRPTEFQRWIAVLSDNHILDTLDYSKKDETRINLERYRGTDGYDHIRYVGKYRLVVKSEMKRQEYTIPLDDRETEEIDFLSSDILTVKFDQSEFSRVCVINRFYPSKRSLQNSQDTKRDLVFPIEKRAQSYNLAWFRERGVKSFTASKKLTGRLRASQRREI